MADISMITIESTRYNIKDSAARGDISILNQRITDIEESGVESGVDVEAIPLDVINGMFN